MAKDKSASIGIIGSGCWGLSTAYHLVKQGYTNVTIFDRATEAPSPFSAANDLNKIVRAQYDDEFYTELGLQAIAAWKTEDWAPYYHQTGHLVTVSGHAPEKAVTCHEFAEDFVTKHKVLSRGVTPLRTRDDIRDVCWQLSGPLSGFRGYFNHLEGYAHSADALRGISQLLAGRGFRFILGPQKGHVVELIYSGADASRRCTGVRSRDGQQHSFDTVICALGAFGASLVPQLGHFNVARCWSVAHVQLTPRECDVLRGIPIVNARDLGFYFEPDPATRLLKLTPLGVGFSNFKQTEEFSGVSLPPSLLGDADAVGSALKDYVPLEDELKMRLLLRETLPWLADRPFVDKKMCWFSDTADSEYCIDFVPGTDDSLVVLSGDSGHGFKMMPIFGEWVCDLLSRGEQQHQRWKWRAERSEGQAADWGTSVSWRFGEAAEISDIVAEKERMEKSRVKL
ncbi:FAD dependent oxidoreductase [Plectosphaerella plurivora]|uniref:FAD dependent oxidoreductase n=1 Tax=Plectosphaerella plurivora TaxID=936078 RepID=A0A9P9A8B6_9PEZI|nr:FAD dependent oxidoreductase [Plectosphaerella plurivora]